MRGLGGLKSLLVRRQMNNGVRIGMKPRSFAKRFRESGPTKRSQQSPIDGASATRIGLIACVGFIGFPMILTYATWRYVSRPENIAQESEESRHRKYRQWKLPLPKDAQKSQVQFIRNFLSEEEIETLKKTVFKMQEDGFPGVVNKTTPGKPWLQTTWKTTYLHTNGAFKERLPWLEQRLWEAVRSVDRSANWDLLPQHGAHGLTFRTAEFHEYWPGGQLSQRQHYDSGSIITMDVMLSDPKEDFQGGKFVTPESDGRILQHDFGKGDAAFFLSHKYHNIRPVSAGKRMVLVVEVWSGPERVCPHRCWSRGACDRKAGDNLNGTTGAVASAAENGWLLG